MKTVNVAADPRSFNRSGSSPPPAPDGKIALEDFRRLLPLGLDDETVLALRDDFDRIAEVILDAMEGRP